MINLFINDIYFKANYSYVFNAHTSKSESLNKMPNLTILMSVSAPYLDRNHLGTKINFEVELNFFASKGIVALPY